MAKDKSSKKVAAPAKTADAVKAGRVTKPAEAPKQAAKATAKSAAKAVDKKEKKSKKVKEPTPEPSSESESEDESESDAASSASSASSDSESDEEVAAPKVNGKTNGKVNGKAAAAAAESESESDSDEADSDESDSEEESAPKAAAVKANGTNGAVKKAESDDDSDDSESDSDDEEDDEKPAAAAAAAAADDSDADSDDSSSSEEEEEEVAKVEEKPNKKRKAENTAEAAPKRSKITVDGEEKDATANLFIGQLSWNIDEEWLTREFETYGEIAGVRIITDRDSGRSKGFGYVEFTDVENAIKAQEAMHGYELDGRNIRVDFSKPRDNAGGNQQQRTQDRASKFGDAPKEPTSTLFVGNISWEADENAISEALSGYGGIKAVRLPTDRDTGALKGFGYVEMQSVDDAKAVLEACNGMDVAGRAIRLDYAAARDNDGAGGGRGGFGGRGGGRGGFDRGGRGGGRGRGGFGDRGGRGGFGGRGRGGKPPGTNRGGFGDFSGRKTTF